MSATLNTFPSFSTFDSPRSWAMAVIVMLHVGFFWALSNGLTHKILDLPPRGTYVDIPDVKEPPKRVDPIKDPDVRPDWVLKVPPPDGAVIETPDDNAFTAQQVDVPVVDPPQTEFTGGSAPVIVEPKIDPRYGFTTPLYPATEVRSGHEGTVLVSVRVGPNGRVMEVRLDRSSGFPRLDESAMREARRWRFIAGTEGGVAAPMWTQVPITFRLQ